MIQWNETPPYGATGFESGAKAVNVSLWIYGNIDPLPEALKTWCCFAVLITCYFLEQEILKVAPNSKTKKYKHLAALPER